jgi:hypothetical protein
MITITIMIWGRGWGPSSCNSAVLCIVKTLIHIQAAIRPGGEMADARDLKSLIRKGVWVRVPPRAIIISRPVCEASFEVQDRSSAGGK